MFSLNFIQINISCKNLFKCIICILYSIKIPLGEFSANWEGFIYKRWLVVRVNTGTSDDHGLIGYIYMIGLRVLMAYSYDAISSLFSPLLLFLLLLLLLRLVSRTLSLLSQWPRTYHKDRKMWRIEYFVTSRLTLLCLLIQYTRC